MNEELVIRGLCQRDAYRRYAGAILALKGLEREHKQILGALGSYWEDYPNVESITPDELVLYFNRLNPALKDKGLYDEILGRIRDLQVGNPDLLADELRCLMETQYANEILKLTLAKVEGQCATVMDKVQCQIKAYEEAVGKLDDDDGIMGDVPLADLLKGQQGPYNWRLPFLRAHIGAPPLGTLGHIYACPEVGKTTFAVFEAVGFAYAMRETDDKVLYLGNEENISRTYLRAFCSYVDRSLMFLRDPENEDEAHALYQNFEKTIKPHLVFVDSVHHINQVELHIKKIQPKVVFIDQGPKVRSLTTETGPAVLTALYNGFREMAKRHDVVLVTLGQADSAAQNRQRLSLANLDCSKVGIPGELDFAIGISKTDDEGKEWVRYLTITKNKLTGSLEHYRGYIDHLKARYK